MLVDKDGHQEFIRQNLYSNKAPEIVSNRIMKFNRPGIIIDPPRSGLKNISSFFPEDTKVETIIYVSCNPSTLFRDIESIPYFKLMEVHLIDLFPFTFHYETICILNKKIP